ncbi:GAF domain-containing protein [candidate division KSB1 bacterium]|nr:GAF domain-containing protein [candidate division KSB1 bacterium]
MRIQCLISIISMIVLFRYNTCEVFPQSYLTHTYNENDGLSNSCVYDVIQDTSGCVWFATRSGISVYDGTNWRSYTAQDGLPANCYIDLEIDVLDRIWALPDFASARISYFDGKDWQHLPAPDFPRASGQLNRFAVTISNDKALIAVGTNQSGVLLYTNGSWRLISTDDGLPSNRINGIISLNGSFCVATDSGLSIIGETYVNNSLNERIHPPEPKIVGIAREGNGLNDRLYLQGENWLGVFEKNEFRLLSDQTEAEFDSKYHHLVLQPDKLGGIFYGNPLNAYYLSLSSGNVKRIGKNNGLIAEGVTAFLLDREKNLWISSLRGVSKIPSRRFANYQKINGLLEDEVTAIDELEPGILVFGHAKGLSFFSADSIHHLTFETTAMSSLADSRVLDLAIDRQNNTWVAASKLGLAKIAKNGKITWYRNFGSPQVSVNTVFVDQTDRVWVATNSSEKLFRIAGNEARAIDLSKLKCNSIRKIFQGPGDALYFATLVDGLILYSNKGWQQYYCFQEKEANSVYAMVQDFGGRILVGTRAGLYQAIDGTLLQFNENGFQIRRPIYVIVKDRKNRLWFGTDNGAIRWDGVESDYFTTHQGFVGQETNRDAGFVDSQGHVWIGTDLGVSCYQEEFDLSPQEIAPPLINLLYVDTGDEKLPLNQVNTFGYNQNNLVFYFQGITFIDEASICFKSKLEGFDADWVETYHVQGQRIRYTSLPHGEFRFHIQVQNALGKWSKIKSSEMIIINPPFWRKWWFHALLTLFALLILFGIERFFSAKRHSAQLEQQVAQRTTRLQASEKRLLEQNRVLVELSTNEMLANGDLPGFLNEITRAAAQTLDVERVSIWFFDNLHTSIQCTDLYVKSTGHHSEGLVFNVADYPIYFNALKIDRTIAADDVHNDPRTSVFSELYLKPLGIVSMLDAQIRIRGRETGVICLEHIGQPRTWTPEEQAFAGSMADFVSLAIEASERKKAEACIKTSLREKEVLLKEIHHRVKNNLQIISSLLNLQSNYIKDDATRGMFQESQNRVKSMALIHERLYQSEDLAQIDFENYVNSLTAYLLSSYRRQDTTVLLNLEIQDVFLDIHSAIPCGLIINELITNSLEHAFPKGGTGEISLSFQVTDPHRFMLKIADNGVGFPDGFDFRNAETLGLQLVVTLVDQLDGTIELDQTQGTAFIIIFKATA